LPPIKTLSLKPPCRGEPQHFVRRAKLAGYLVTIVFIYLDSADTSVARVRERVRRGGHDVPESDIRRRFHRCFSNFWRIYREIAD
jgi:predicted ABC-type ATPase